jgi:hypothetical protein
MLIPILNIDEENLEFVWLGKTFTVSVLETGRFSQKIPVILLAHFFTFVRTNWPPVFPFDYFELLLVHVKLFIDSNVFVKASAESFSVLRCHPLIIAHKHVECSNFTKFIFLHFALGLREKTEVFAKVVFHKIKWNPVNFIFIIVIFEFLVW